MSWQNKITTQVLRTVGHVLPTLPVAVRIQEKILSVSAPDIIHLKGRKSPALRIEMAGHVFVLGGDGGELAGA